MTDAREIIARHLCAMASQGWSEISAFERAAYRTTAAGMVEAITSAGFRILGPDEVDGSTVEKCARTICELAKYMKDNDRFLKPEGMEELSLAISALAEDKRT